MYGVIYKTTCLITNKIYIGQHKCASIEKFYKKKYIGSGSYLREVINKYGISNFKCEIVCICYDFEDMNKNEINFIKLHKSLQPNGYNISFGGAALMKNRRHTEEAKRKNAEAHTGEKNASWGKKRTQETKNKMSASAMGNTNGKYRKNTKHSEETKRKLSLAAKEQWRRIKENKL